MSIAVRATTQQKALLTLALLSVVLATLLIPLGAFSGRWLVIEAPTTNHFIGGVTIGTNREFEYGLLRTCVVNPDDTRCSGNNFGSGDINTTSTCAVSASAMKARHNTTFAFLFLAFLVCLPLSILSLMYVCNAHRVGNQSKPVDCGICALTGDRKRGAVVRIALTSVALLFALIALAVYGNTIGYWAACGEHYCAALISQTQANMPALIPPGVARYETDIACGYGYSFGAAVMGLVSLVGALLFVICEYSSAGSEIAAKDADEPQAFVISEGPRNVDQAAEFTPHEEMKPLPQEQHYQQQQQQQQQKPRFARGTDRQDSYEEPRGQMKSSAPPSAAAPPTETYASRETSAPIGHTQAYSQSPEESRSPQRPKGAHVPQGNDWEYDQDADLYWSPSQRLYFDERSGHFFDPESDLWFDPAAQKWYKLAQ